jgi:hypothetical protein
MRKNRLLVAAVGALAVTGLVAPLAGAAKPAVEVFPIAWTDMDPCTGLMHSFTGQGTQTTIWNNHVVLQRLVVEGTTDSGYIATGAPIRYQYKEDQFKYLVAQTFRNPSTGDIFQAKIRVMEQGGEPTMEVAEIRCVTGPTTYWPE